MCSADAFYSTTFFFPMLVHSGVGYECLCQDPTAVFREISYLCQSLDQRFILRIESLLSVFLCLVVFP